MIEEEIIKALDEIAPELDQTIKNLRLASLTSAVFRDAGFELVVAGGSAIEVYTEGA